MTEEPLKKRYFYRLASNLAGVTAGLITAAVVPRALGPGAYGNFSFLTNFFSQLLSFFDMGTSTAFYIKLSQRNKEQKMIIFYFYFSILVVLLTFLMVAGSFFLKIGGVIWPSQEGIFICAAAIWGILNWFSNHIMNRITDAYGLTVVSEKVIIIQRFFSTVLLLALFFSGCLGLKEYFLYHYVIIAFLCIGWWQILKWNGIYLLKKIRLTYLEIVAYYKEFYDYTSPLAVLSIAGFITAIFDRWILQIYGDSTQQGFYGLSNQIGIICFFFTNALTPLLMREFSIAFTNNDLNQMSLLFRRYIPLLYSIAAYFGCFIAIQADKVVHIFGGNRFNEAIMPVAIMSLYPIHQTYGQLSGSVFYATGETKLYRNICIIFMLIGLPMTYFLIAPSEKMGLNTGATGLAIKMVVLQFIAVNVQLFFNTRFLKLSFWRYLGHQIFSVGFMLIIAAFATFIAYKPLGFAKNIISSFLLAGFFYTLMVIGLIYYLPVIVGLKKQEIQRGVLFIFKKGD